MSSRFRSACDWRARWRCSAAAARSESRELRVCADPDNLPFSHQDGSGFENRIAELVAEEMDARLATNGCRCAAASCARRSARVLCDVLHRRSRRLGTRAHDARLLSLELRASSTRTDWGPPASIVRRPALAHLRVGVQLVGNDRCRTLRRHALARHGIVDNVTRLHDLRRRPRWRSAWSTRSRRDSSTSPSCGDRRPATSRDGRCRVEPRAGRGRCVGVRSRFRHRHGVRDDETRAARRARRHPRPAPPDIDAILAQYSVPRTAGRAETAVQRRHELRARCRSDDRRARAVGDRAACERESRDFARKPAPRPCRWVTRPRHARDDRRATSATPTRSRRASALPLVQLHRLPRQGRRRLRPGAHGRRTGSTASDPDVDLRDDHGGTAERHAVVSRPHSRRSSLAARRLRALDERALHRSDAAPNRGDTFLARHPSRSWISKNRRPRSPPAAPGRNERHARRARSRGTASRAHGRLVDLMLVGVRGRVRGGDGRAAMGAVARAASHRATAPDLGSRPRKEAALRRSIGMR